MYASLEIFFWAQAIKKNGNILEQSCSREKGLCLFHEFPRHPKRLEKDVPQYTVFRFFSAWGNNLHVSGVSLLTDDFVLPSISTWVLNKILLPVWSGCSLLNENTKQLSSQEVVLNKTQPYCRQLKENNILILGLVYKLLGFYVPISLTPQEEWETKYK